MSGSEHTKNRPIIHSVNRGQILSTDSEQLIAGEKQFFLSKGHFIQGSMEII